MNSKDFFVRERIFLQEIKWKKLRYRLMFSWTIFNTIMLVLTMTTFITGNNPLFIMTLVVSIATFAFSFKETLASEKGLTNEYTRYNEFKDKHKE